MKLVASLPPEEIARRRAESRRLEQLAGSENEEEEDVKPRHYGRRGYDQEHDWKKWLASQGIAVAILIMFFMWMKDWQKEMMQRMDKRADAEELARAAQLVELKQIKDEVKDLKNEVRMQARRR